MEEQQDEKLWQLAKHSCRFFKTACGFIMVSGICWVFGFYYRNYRHHVLAFMGIVWFNYWRR